MIVLGTMNAYTMMCHPYVAEISATLSTSPSHSDLRGTTTFIVGGESSSLSYIQGDIYYNESYKVGSEIECRGLKSPAITRGA